MRRYDEHRIEIGEAGNGYESAVCRSLSLGR